MVAIVLDNNQLSGPVGNMPSSMREIHVEKNFLTGKMRVFVHACSIAMEATVSRVLQCTCLHTFPLMCW